LAYDIQPEERALMLEAGKEGGKYLQSINKTDFARLTKEEWTHFLEIVIMHYQSVPF